METWYLIIMLLGTGKAVDHVAYTNEAQCVAERNMLAAELEEQRTQFVLRCSKDR